jgi:hypothetical protein
MFNFFYINQQLQAFENFIGNSILQTGKNYGVFTGIVIVKQVDLSISEFTSIEPLCACIMFKVEARPKPMPFLFEV